MSAENSTTERPAECSPSQLAQRFGRRTVELMREGREVYESARLAGSFAQQAIAARPKVVGYIGPDAPWGITQ